MIGNYSQEDYNLACICCGKKDSLMQVAHRNEDKKVVGYIFVCHECFSCLPDKIFECNIT